MSDLTVLREEIFTSLASTKTQIDELGKSVAKVFGELTVLETALGEFFKVLDAPPSRIVRGMTPWFNPWKKKLDLKEIFESDLSDSVSVWVRPSDITKDGITYDLAPLYEVVKARNAFAPDKGIGFMLNIGTVELGLSSAYWTKDLKDYELINLGSVSDPKTVPAFYSEMFQRKLDTLWYVVSSKFKDELDQVRISLSWGPNAEPYGLQSAFKQYSEKAAKYLGRPSPLTPVEMDDLYKDRMARATSLMSTRFPPRVVFSTATGLAFGDSVGSKPNTDPGRHPAFYDYMVNWRSILYPREFVAQSNGENEGPGAGGFGEWLVATLGPSSKHSPGPIGAQPIGGVVESKKRLFPVATKFGPTVDQAALEGFRFFEIYIEDFLSALHGDVENSGPEIAEVIRRNKTKWISNRVG